MKLACRIAIALPLLLLGGCRVTQSLTSEVEAIPLASARDTQCITAAIERTAGVTHVEFRPSPEGVPSPRPLWLYGFGDHRATLSIFGIGEIARYTNRFGVRGSREAPAQLDAFEPVMAAVNRRLESECGLPLDGPLPIQRSFSSIF